MLASAPPPGPPLKQVVALYTTTALLAAAFVYVHSRLVCTYMCDLPPWKLARTLVLLAALQIVGRPLLWRAWPAAPGVSPARHAWRMGVATWLGTGALGVAIHLWLYPTFEWGSHAKLFVGYALLGGGVLAQAEYLAFERMTAADTALPRLSERLGRRLLESYGVFTVVPATVLLLGLFRVTAEGALNEARVAEGAFLGVFFVGAALTVAFAFGRSLQRDAARLQLAVEQIGGGALGTRVRTSRPDELGVVAEGINAMAEGLVERDALRDAFGRFTSPEVARRVIAAFSRPDQGLMLGGRRVTVTLLLCDLRGFTPLTEQLEPERLSALLNGWFAEAVAAVHAEGGLVDKFIGDAVFAVFGLGGEPEAPAAALRAARGMQDRLVAFNARREPQDPALDIGVAVHTGEVTAGFFGSPERLEFTVIGRTANEVARLSDQARAPLPSVLVSEATARLLPDAGLSRVGELRLKGVGEVVGVYGA